MRKVLANTTPLIALANIDRLDLLNKLYGTIIVPQAVMDEIVREPARQRVRNASWIKVELIQDHSQKDIFRARLHAGEVEVMILAREQKADLVIMDDDVRKIPKAVEIAKKTMGIVTENIVFALAVKLVILILSAFGLASMWAAVFGDVGVTILCILNAMRMLIGTRKPQGNPVSPR